MIYADVLASNGGNRRAEGHGRSGEGKAVVKCLLSMMMLNSLSGFGCHLTILFFNEAVSTSFFHVFFFWKYMMGCSMNISPG